MDFHYGYTVRVSTSDGERLGPRSFRPDPDDYAKAQEQLRQRGRRMGDYLRACIAWLLADPDAAIEALQAHWPPPRPRGWQAHRRPRQQDGPPPGT
jgi:hypothetical protein